MKNSEAGNQIQMSQREISILDVVLVAWKDRKIVLGFLGLTLVLGILIAVCISNYYTSEALVMPTSQTETGAQFGSNVGSIASIVGLNLEADDAKASYAKEVLKSRKFLEDFIARHELAPILLATEGWDSEAGRWLYDSGLFDAEKGEWKAIDGISTEPSNWDLVNEFKEDLVIGADVKNGMLKISFSSKSPHFSQQVVEMLIKDINDYIRDEDIAAAQSKIEYLEDKLKQTNVAEMQQMFYELIQSETRTVMLANAHTEYVFKTVDPAVPPAEKSGPNRVLILAVSVFLGLFGGVGLSLMMRALNRSFRKPSQEPPSSEIV